MAATTEQVARAIRPTSRRCSASDSGGAASASRPGPKLPPLGTTSADAKSGRVTHLAAVLCGAEVVADSSEPYGPGARHKVPGTVPPHAIYGGVVSFYLYRYGRESTRGTNMIPYLS